MSGRFLTDYHRRPVFWAPGRVQLELGRDPHLEQTAQHSLTRRSPTPAPGPVPSTAVQYYQAARRNTPDHHLQRKTTRSTLFDPSIPVFEARPTSCSLFGRRAGSYLNPGDLTLTWGKRPGPDSVRPAVHQLRLRAPAWPPLSSTCVHHVWFMCTLCTLL